MTGVQTCALPISFRINGTAGHLRTNEIRQGQAVSDRAFGRIGEGGLDLIPRVGGGCTEPVENRMAGGSSKPSSTGSATKSALLASVAGRGDRLPPNLKDVVVNDVFPPWLRVALIS